MDVPTKLVLEDVSRQGRRDSASSLESGFGDGDNLSVHSTDSYASIRSDNSDDGYDSIKFDSSGFIDDNDNYQTLDQIKENAPVPQNDLKDEDQYALVDDLNLGDAPDSPEVNEESRETLDTNTRDEGGIGEANPEGSNTGGNSEEGSSGESQHQPTNMSDEPTISKDDVLARKYAAYEQLLDNDNFGALEQKLSNTNSYQTAKQVAQLALEKQGKTSLVFMVAQNRMQELKADQLFDQLGGFGQGADYDLIREQAAEAMNQNKYSPGYQSKVMELVDQKLDKYRDVIANAPPPVQSKSEELVKELEAARVQAAQIETETHVEEAPPLPPRPETPAKSKKRGRRMPGFLRRDG